MWVSIDVGSGIELPKNFKHIETKLIHAGKPEPRMMSAVSMMEHAMTETSDGR